MDELVQQRMKLQAMNGDEMSGGNMSQLPNETFQNLCGAYYKGGYDKNLEYVITNSVTDISSGSSKQVENAYINHNISLNDQDVLYYLDRSAIIYDLALPASVLSTNTVGTCILKSAQQVIETSQWSIGKIAGSYTNQLYLQNMQLITTPKDKLRKTKGLLCRAVLEHAGIDQLVPAIGADAQKDRQWQTLRLSQGTMLFQQYYSKFETGGPPITSRTLIFKCVVPLNLCLGFDTVDNTLYCGMGQTIQLKMKGVQAAQILQNGEEQVLATGVQAISTSKASAGYQMRDIKLLKCFTALGSGEVQKIQSSVVQIPITRFMHGGEQTKESATISLSLGSNDSLEYVWLSFNPKGSGALLTGLDSAENIVSQDEEAKCSTLRYPMNCIALPLKQLTLSFGSGQQTLTDTEIIPMTFYPEVFGQENCFDNPLERSLNTCYKIDIRRFTQDVVGSYSSKKVIPFQLSYTLATGVKTIYQQAADWDAAKFATYNTNVFVQYKNMGECKYGIYQI